MSHSVSALMLLHAGCAALYAGLATLILVRQRQSRSRPLAGGRMPGYSRSGQQRSPWAGAAYSADRPAGSDLLARRPGTASLLHLYRRTVTVHRQLMQAFTTMGLLGLLLVGGLPLIDMLSEGSPASALVDQHCDSARFCRLQPSADREPLFQHARPNARWHINLLCVALAGLFLYDLVLYADALLFRRISMPLFEGRASATALAAPLIALAAARNRRWAIDIHVSRNVVFHSARW